MASPAPPSRTAIRAALILAIVAFAALRGLTAYRDNVNWDEFALLNLAARTAQSGELHGGGRPGLAVLAVLPWVRECSDEIAVVRTLRLVWVGVSLVLLGGLAALLLTLHGDRPHRAESVALGVALLAAVPAFLQWSIQVRTDHLALAAGLWGAVLALRSERDDWLAVPAGVLFGAGYLASPKAVYLMALAALLCAAGAWQRGSFRLRRETWRALLGIAGAGLCLGAFELGVGSAFEAPAGAAAADPGPVVAPGLRNGLDVFSFYRHTIGYSQYAELLPQLVPHALLLLGLAAATLRRRDGGARELGVAWGVLALGIAVGLFHAAAFSYFWMTLGLFPAIAAAVAWPGLRRSLERVHRLAPRAALAGLAALLVLPAIAQSARLLRDTQQVQRASLAFVAERFGAEDTGFQLEGALFCHLDEDPLPTYFSQHLWMMFGRGPDARERNVRRLIQTFERKQIRYLVESFRLRQLPPELQDFLAEHFVPYRDAVWVAGRRLSGRAGQTSEWSLLAGGEYRWLPLSAPRAIHIDGVRVEPGGVIPLAAGRHRSRLDADLEAGVLVTSVGEPPAEGQLAFYKRY